MSQGNRLNRPKMKQDFFKNLPSEIVIDILLRLPVRSVISCKCAQKSWLHLVETKEFVEPHFSKSVPGLIICNSGLLSPKSNRSKVYKLFEFKDGFNVEHHDLHYKLVAKFNLTSCRTILGSADGLLLLGELSSVYPNCGALYICNPITNEYINLHCSQESRNSNRQPITRDYFNRHCFRELHISNLQGVTYGFGSSKTTRKYKVVRIFQDRIQNYEAECCVYTLGTGSWRRLAPCAWVDYKALSIVGVFANGILHWLVSDLEVGHFFLRISCFDLEMESFSTLSAPPFPRNGENKNPVSLSLFAWGDCLGLCDNTFANRIVVWLMKEYGVEKSWTKEFVLSNGLEYNGIKSRACPIKVFEDGDILILWNEILIYYSSKTKTTHRVDMFKWPCGRHFNAMIHTPSFLSLKSFSLENVSSF